MKKIQILTSIILLSGFTLLSACKEQPGLGLHTEKLAGGAGVSSPNTNPQFAKYICAGGSQEARTVEVRVTGVGNAIDDAKKAFCYGQDASCMDSVQCFTPTD